MALDSSPTINTLDAALRQSIGARTGSSCQISGLKLIPGGASQEAWALDVAIRTGPHAGTHALILRRDMGGALSTGVLTRRQEFEVVQAVYAAGVRAPMPYWFIGADELCQDGRDAFLMQRLQGETIGRRIVRDPALAEARQLIAAEMGRALAGIHAVATTLPDLAFLRPPEPAGTAAETAINRLIADLDAVDEPHPAIELGIRWLVRHDPGPSPSVLLHGRDYRIGNMVVGPDGLRGILDWESAHIGDAHADLAWPSVRAWRFGMHDLDFGGISTRDRFIAAYERASGRQVDPFRLFYWEVAGNLRWAVGALGQARRHLRGLERSIELAALGRIAAEMEHEALTMIAQDAADRRHAR